MLRRIAAKSRLINHKVSLETHFSSWVPPPHQNLRFLSNLSVNTTYSESHPSSLASSAIENGDGDAKITHPHPDLSETGNVHTEHSWALDEEADAKITDPQDFSETSNAQTENLWALDKETDARITDPQDLSETGNVQTENSWVSDEEDNFTHEIDTVKLEKVLSLLQSSTDASLKSTLDDMRIRLHADFVVKVLGTPHVLGDNLIKFFSWAINKRDVCLTTDSVDALVRAICIQMRKKDAYALWDLIQDIGEKENHVLNADILNKLIGLFSKLGKGKAAFEVFNKFGNFGCATDSDTYYYTIEALCRRSFFDWASLVHEKMLAADALPDSEKVGKIICWFCKGDKVDDAYLVYLSAKEKSVHLPRSCVNLLISLLCQKDETVKLAMQMLDGFSGSTRKLAIKPFSSVIRGLCRIQDLYGAKMLLSKMIDDGPPPGLAVFNSIINGYSKFGDMEEAIEMKKLIERRGLKPNLFTYTVIMSGYVRSGQIEEACKILSEAKRQHSKLTPIMYHTLIRGYCKLEQFDKALDLLSEMNNFGVQTNADEYTKLIQSLCLKTLDWEKAEKLMEKMKEEGLHLNAITRGLIKAVKELEEEGIETVEA